MFVSLGKEQSTPQRLDTIRSRISWASIEVFRKRYVNLIDNNDAPLQIRNIYEMPENTTYTVEVEYESVNTRIKQMYRYNIFRSSSQLTISNDFIHDTYTFNIDTSPDEHYVFHTQTLLFSKIEGTIYLTTKNFFFVPKMLLLVSHLTFNYQLYKETAKYFIKLPLQLLESTLPNNLSLNITVCPFYHPTIPTCLVFNFTSQTFVMSVVHHLASLRFQDGGESPLNKIPIDDSSDHGAKLQERVDGIYNPNIELTRQDMEKSFMITDVNARFQLCPTYPTVLVVPIELSNKQVLKNIARFRCKGRIPLVTYYSSKTGAALFRSSQPLVATTFAFGVFKQSQSQEDQDLIHHLRCDGRDENAKLFVLDCRAVANSVANRFNGGGTESTNSYKNCTIYHLNLPNIHTVYSAYQKMVTGINLRNERSVSEYYSYVSDWFDILQNICESVNKTVILLNNGDRVLVHCSDGWDRTPQISALSRICLDSYHRTLEGFLSLIEFEWIMLGHRFQFRLRNNLKENSPVFLQFLEIVVMFLRKYPTDFEFKENLLVDLAVESVCPTTGTFLYNCEAEREKFDVAGTRTSFFKKVMEEKQKYKNKNYVQDDDNFVLRSHFEIYEFVVWKDFYLRDIEYSCEVPDK
ncbi:myotubularin, putative [Entamoeba invadens IP1]|uniref:myotubularin, putative n=1 Tax=Entamoeba invadens IP1 TaxID=370355 RepID=UPI0002C3F14C|nr:myotubularin, putative [Entamoeba invadens IP1]ELP85277.1 myotubularin, putative [Entamoeba invadens IP1]|eukprot:XP_004184623.1 myotubularin, putative [Entamoeba invadens IP1]